MIFRFVDSPLGEIFIASEDGQLTWLTFRSGPQTRTPDPEWTHAPRNALLLEVKSQLDRYFDGTLRRFDVPLGPRGTPFQRRVWQALGKIPYGTTRTYSQLARTVRRPAAHRAVGAANGQNPISVIIPCHRLVGKDGSLTGYGGGLDRKQALLELEGARESVPG